jgi:cytochrome P450
LQKKDTFNTNELNSSMSKYNFPKGYSAFKTLFKTKAFLDNPIIFMADSMTNFGDTYSATIGLSQKVIITQEPDFISHVLKDNHKNYKKSKFSSENAVELFGRGLLFSNGAYWLKQRRLIQPAFHKEKIKGLYDIVINAINTSLHNFPVGNDIDVFPYVHKISFSILIKSLFDIHIPETTMEQLGSTFGELQTFFIKDVNKPLEKFTYPFTGAKKKALEKAANVRAIFRKIIEERKASKESFSDLLDMLLHSKYEDTGTEMEEEQVIDELIILIFAGHETTANTISWMLHLIANDTETQQKLNSVSNDCTILESLNNEYLKAVMYEGMRLYPAAWMTERVAIEDDNFNGLSFPKNTIIVSFFYGLHRNKTNWEDADKFYPQRFLNDPSLARSKNFFPFGAGPRMCIGNNFAIAEMAFFLHAFFAKFTITPTIQSPQMKPLITLKPDKVVLNIARL